jgi:hypothetical protein
MTSVFYIIEAILSFSTSSVFVVLFLVHLISHTKFSELLGAIHKACHIGGLICSLFLIMWSIDPQGALGIHSWKSILVLKDCFTCTAYFILMKCIMNGIIILSASQGTRSRFVHFLDQRQNTVCAIATAIGWIIAVVVDYTVITNDFSRTYGIFLLYLSASFAISVLIMCKILVDFYQVKKSLSRSSSCCDILLVKDTQKLRYTVLGLTLVVAVQAWIGANEFINPGRMSVTQVTPDASKPNFCIWMLVDIIGLIIIIHLSWLPVIAPISFISKRSSKPTSRVQGSGGSIKAGPAEEGTAAVGV